MVGALQGCSSSSSPAGAQDAGGRDGTTATDGSGGGQDAPIDVFTATDAGADTATGDVAVPEEASEPEEASTVDAKSDGAAEAGEGGEAGQDAGTIADCGSTPTLHVNEAGTIFCGFADADIDCPTGQECCLGGYLDGGAFAAQQCAAYGATCTNGTLGSDADSPPIPVMCAQISDCKANGLSKAVACCLRGATAPVDQPTCVYPRATLGTAIVCESSDAGANGAAACATGEVQICSSQADCPTGTTCTPGKWKILDLGFCQ